MQFNTITANTFSNINIHTFLSSFFRIDATQSRKPDHANKTKISLVALTLSALLTIPAYAASTSPASHSASEPMNAVVQTESDKANALFETIFMENIMASPISQTYMGIKQDYDKWDELGDAADDKALARTKNNWRRSI